MQQWRMRIYGERRSCTETLIERLANNRLANNKKGFSNKS